MQHKYVFYIGISQFLTKNAQIVTILNFILSRIC